MNTVSKWLVLLCTMLCFGATAEPYLAYKNNLKCMACHINPNGGGARNDFGRTYGHNVMAANPLETNLPGLLRYNEYLQLGLNARHNIIDKEDNRGNKDSGGGLENAQVYMNIEIADSGFSFYLDHQFAPGSGMNREAYLMYKMSNNHYIKAGKIFLPYGLRIEDDEAFIRGATSQNFDNNDEGIVLGLDYQKTTVNLYVSEGGNDDDNYLYGARAEHLFDSFRLGGSIVINDTEQQTRLYNIYGGTRYQDFTFMASMDWINLEAANFFTGKDINQIATLLEANYQWRPGWNFKLTYEYFDPDRDVSEDEQVRWSFVTEYTPFSSLQFRLGIRKKEDIPQKPRQNFDVMFFQTHVYF